MENSKKTIEEMEEELTNATDPAEVLRQQAQQNEQAAARESVLEALKAQRERAELEEKAKRRPHIFRHPEERERV